jgi:Tfp pilus assembly protein PilF
VYKTGEEKLLAVKEKATGDYLVLARLAAARGDIKLAAERAEKGIELDKSNYDLNVALVKYYQILGDKQKEMLYQNRLNELNIIRNIK